MKFTIEECYTTAATLSMQDHISTDVECDVKHLLMIYNKYANCYTTRIESTANQEEDEEAGGELRMMVLRTIKMNENACTVFNETTDCVHGIGVDDLERIFELGLDDDHPSIKSIIARQIKGFRHLLKYRSANTLDPWNPTVTVQYILVWKKKDTPLF